VKMWGISCVSYRRRAFVDRFITIRCIWCVWAVTLVGVLLFAWCQRASRDAFYVTINETIHDKMEQVASDMK